MKALILCATQRSGSTMVCDDMRGITLLGNPEEHYIPWVSSKLGAYDWNEEQKNVIKRASTQNNVASIKIMSNQILAVSEKLNTTLSKSKENLLDVFPAVFNDAVWVRIIRKNTIKQAISRVMARQTNVCHTVEKDSDKFFAGKTINYDEDYNKNSRFDYKQILNDISNIKKEEEFINTFLSHNNIKPIKIIYEDAAKNPEPYLKKISEAIGLDKNDVKIRERKIKKLPNKRNNDWYLKTLEKYAEKLFAHGGI